MGDGSVPEVHTSSHPADYRDGVRYGRLGELEVSVVGLGCNNFGGRVDLAGTKAVVDAALDAGITPSTPRTSTGTRAAARRFLGELLEGRRDRVVLATKFGMDMGDGETARGRRDYVRRAVEDSLGRLRTDRDRPPLLPPPRRRDAVRGDARGDGRARPAKARHGSSATRTSPPSNSTRSSIAARGGLPRSSRSRTSTACSSAGRPSVLPRRGTRARLHPLVPARERAADRQVPPRRAGPEGTRLHGQDDRLTPEVFDTIERLEAFARARALAARARDRRARLAPGDPVGDRRRDETRAGAGERRRRRPGARRRRLEALSRLSAAPAG